MTADHFGGSPRRTKITMLPAAQPCGGQVKQCQRSLEPPRARKARVIPYFPFRVDSNTAI